MSDKVCPQDEVKSAESAEKRLCPDSDPLDKVLLEPYRYVLQIPGKKVRLKLATAFNHWLKIPDDKLAIIAEVTQMLHNASLIIDDIEDNSSLRRGIPVAHHIFGVASTINAANYAYFLGLEKVFSLNHPDATKVYTEQLLELHRGQGMDIYWRDTYQCPTEDEYRLMVIRKTGGLFGLAVRLMQLFSDNKSNLKPLLDNLGLYFQIRDDYANLVSKEEMRALGEDKPPPGPNPYEANKTFAEDLTEGKFSFPVIHAIRQDPRDEQVMSILRQRTKDFDVKKYCVEKIRSQGAFAYTETVLNKLRDELLSQIAALGGNPHLSALMQEFAKLHTGKSVTTSTNAQAGGES